MNLIYNTRTDKYEDDKQKMQQQLLLTSNALN